MGVSGDRGRRKLFACLAVLGAVWAYAAVHTGGDVADLFRARTVGESLGQPTDEVILALQEERRLSTIKLVDSGQSPALAEARQRTDATHAALRTSLDRSSVRWAAGDATVARTDDLLDRLRALAATRSGVDSGSLEREAAAADYSRTIDAALSVYDAPAVWADPRLAQGGHALGLLSRVREALSRQDALVRGALTAGGLTDGERAALQRLVGVHRYLHSEAAATLSGADLARFRQLADDPRYAELRTAEDRLVQPDDAGGPPVDLARWTASADPVLAGLHELVRSAASATVTSATPGGVTAIVRAGLVGGLGLVAVVAMAILIRRVRVTPESHAPGGDRSVAADGDPASGEGLSDGGPPSVADDSGTGDGRPVAGDGVGTARATAGVGPARAATGDGSSGPDDRLLHELLLDLNRRNQALLHRQLRVLDMMERREADDDDLGDLFRADHLATRMRRNIEKLVALAGGAPARRWRRPVPVVDVVRAAAAEVADYRRVAAYELEPAGLVGTAVVDVTHLLAELIENATTFSPPQARVRVSGSRSDDGYAITVIDGGPGMSAEDLATAEEVLHSGHPPRGGAWWGLYAVGRLAERHGVTVSLANSVDGGLIAMALLPAPLVTGSADALVTGATDPDTEAATMVIAPVDVDGSPRTQYPTADSARRSPRMAPPSVPPSVPAAGHPDARDGDHATPPAGAAGRTSSGLPTRVRGATGAAAAAVPTRRAGRAAAEAPPDRLARLRMRAQAAAAETMELPVAQGNGDLPADGFDVPDAGEEQGGRGT